MMGKRVEGAGCREWGADRELSLEHDKLQLSRGELLLLMEFREKSRLEMKKFENH